MRFEGTRLIDRLVACWSFAHDFHQGLTLGVRHIARGLRPSSLEDAGVGASFGGGSTKPLCTMPHSRVL